MESLIERVFPDFSASSWSFYKSGSCNNVFKTTIDGESWVLKIQKKSDEDIMMDMSNPERFKRKSDGINTGFSCQLHPGYKVLPGKPATETEILNFTVYVYSHRLHGWLVATYRDKANHIHNKILNTILDASSHAILLQKIISPRPHLSTSMGHRLLDILKLERPGIIMPFIGHGQAQPTDHEITAKVLEVYTRTRNIIADACIPGNMLKLQDEIICIDLDFAIQRDSELSKEYLAEPENMLAYESFWDAYLASNLNTCSVEMVRTLFYLESHLAAVEIIDAYLTPELIDKYHGLRTQKMHISVHYINVLQAIITHYPEHTAHASFISSHLLDSIDLGAASLEQHIADVFMEFIAIAALISPPPGKRDSVYGFYAPALAEKTSTTAEETGKSSGLR